MTDAVKVMISSKERVAKMVVKRIKCRLPALSPFPTMFAKILFCKVINPFPNKLWFLAPLAKGQQAIVMALCPSCVGLSVSPSVRPSVRALPSENFSSETMDWIFTKFHRNVP